MFLARDQAAFESDRVKLAGWVDIGQNLLCGFAQRREYRKLRQHGENPAEKWLAYSTPKSERLGKRYPRPRSETGMLVKNDNHQIVAVRGGATACGFAELKSANSVSTPSPSGSGREVRTLPSLQKTSLPF